MAKRHKMENGELKMLVAEIIKRKNNIKQKIEELDYYLEKVASLPTAIEGMSNQKDAVHVYNTVINTMFDLLDSYQNHIILLAKSNNINNINVGKSEIKVSDAVVLMRTINEKINTLTRLIISKDTSINVPNLIEQRDKLMEEQILIDNAIQQSDWSVEIE